MSLKALAILQEKYPNVHLTVAGTGAALEEARQYVADNRILNVTFAGYVRGEEKAEVYSHAHCCLFPTWHPEGMPITVVEAMAFGLPVITRPVGALADFFRDGEMGFLTESRDPAVFAQLVGRLIEDPELCTRIDHTNRRYAHDRFAASVVARELLRLYTETACARCSNTGNGVTQ